MNQPRFSTEYPTSEVPILPEYFRKNTIEGLMPSTPVYPYAYAIKSDTASGVLHVNKSIEIDGDAQDPNYFGERTGLMRVLETHDGEVVDGYVADLRHIHAGKIDSQIIYRTSESGQDIDAYDGPQLLDTDMQPLLAAVFNDPDGNPHFVGDSRMVSHAEALMAHVDARTGVTQYSEVQPVADEPQDIPEGYYLG